VGWLRKERTKKKWRELVGKTNIVGEEGAIVDELRVVEPSLKIER